MSAHHLARTIRLLALALLLVVATTATAHAGVVTRDGSVLIYTSNNEQADALWVRQGDAVRILFDDRLAPVTTTAPGCQVLNGDVLCSNTAWTAVRVDARDRGDVVVGSVDAGTIVGVPMTILGGAGRDSLIGGSAADRIDPGVDGGSANGGGGNDTLRQSANASVSFEGGEGDDTLDARLDTGLVADELSYLDGGPGNDVLRAGPNANQTILRGGTGDDQLFGAGARDDMNGGPGRDTLSGGAGDDVLHGGSTTTGNLQTSDGQDTIAGGEGIDLLSYGQRTTSVTVDLATVGGDGELGENDATAADIENIRGGDAADVLLGNGASNDINGFRGADQVDGRGGFDQVRGGSDADTITASGDGVADFVECGTTFTTGLPQFPEGSDQDTANLDHLDLLAQLADCETVNRLAPPALPTTAGSAAGETLRGTGAADELLGRGGNDTIFGFGGSDRIRGGTGNDTLYGGGGNDDIDGDAGNDRLFGQPGDDSLDGGRGADLLRGGPGRDQLAGGFGRDNLHGGAGRDFLLSRDGARLDVVTCSLVNLATAAGRLQRDIVVADRSDVIRNRRYCARVTFT